MTDRSIVHPAHLQAVKRATRALVGAAGGQEACAAETGRSQSRISAYCLPNTADFMPLDVALALEAITVGLPGAPHITRLFAREAGFALVRLPTAPTGNSDWHKALGGLSREVGEVVERVCKVLSDAETPGSVTASEVREEQLVEEIDDAIEKLVAMKALATRALEEGGGG